MNVLVINCGSSSLKYQLINMQDESVLCKGLCERIGIDGSRIICVTGTSFKTFTLDKTLEHLWDEMITNFLHQKGIPFEQQ